MLFFCQGGSQTAILDQLPGVLSGSENAGNLYITYRLSCEYIDHTVDGSEIRRSPVDMVNIPIIYRFFFTFQVVVGDFFHPQYDSDMFCFICFSSTTSR